jgi:hypothetical protein
MVYGTSGAPKYIKAYHRCYDPSFVSYIFSFVVRLVGIRVLYADQGDPVDGLCFFFVFVILISLFLFLNEFLNEI